jgi:hypothetical protein
LAAADDELGLAAAEDATGATGAIAALELGDAGGLAATLAGEVVPAPHPARTRAQHSPPARRPNARFNSGDPVDLVHIDLIALGCR